MENIIPAAAVSQFISANLPWGLCRRLGFNDFVRSTLMEYIWPEISRVGWWMGFCPVVIHFKWKQEQLDVMEIFYTVMHWTQQFTVVHKGVSKYSDTSMT